MTTENELDSAIWEWLQKIKIKLATTPKRKLKGYVVDPTLTLMLRESEYDSVYRTLTKIEDFRAIEVTKGAPVGGTDISSLFVKVVQPRFDEIYRKYRKLFDTVFKQTAEISEEIAKQTAEELSKPEYSELLSQKKPSGKKIKFELLKDISDSNLRKIRGVVNLLLEEIELVGIQTAKPYKIAFESLKRYRVSFDDFSKVINLLDKLFQGDAIRLINDDVAKKSAEMFIGRHAVFFKYSGVKPNDDRKYAIYEITINDIKPELVKLRDYIYKKTSITSIDLTSERMVSDSSEETPKQRPFTLAEGEKGYLKFNKNGKKILIGSINSRHFRLLQSLCAPLFGIHKRVEGVFEAIRLLEDEDDLDLLPYSPRRKAKIISIIENAKKELQRGSKLQGRIKLRMDINKTEVWLELV